MVFPDFGAEHLRQLPLRAIVAFAARCARRVEPLAQLPDGHPERDRRRDAVKAALGMAEGFANGSTAPPEGSVLEAIDASRAVAGAEVANASAVAAVAVTARAAAAAWHLIDSQVPEKDEPRELRSPEARKVLGALTTVTADVAALDAFTAAAEAFAAVGYHNEAFVAAALSDYEKLLHLKLGHYPEPGSAIDPAPGGPLGPL